VQHGTIEELQNADPVRRDDFSCFGGGAVGSGGVGGLGEVAHRIGLSGKGRPRQPAAIKRDNYGSEKPH